MMSFKVVEGCSAGVVRRRAILEMELVPVFVPSVCGLVGFVGVALGWDFGTAGYAAFLGLPVVAWTVFAVASWVVRRGVVSRPSSVAYLSSGARPSSESAYRERVSDAAAEPGGDVVRHVGRLCRLEPVRIKVWRSPLRGDEASGGIVAGCVYHRRWIWSGELFIWIGEAVVVDDEGHAVVLLAPRANARESSIANVAPVQACGGARLWPMWAGDDAAVKVLRGILPRAVASLLMDGDKVVLEAHLAEAAPPARASRAAVEARVGPVKSLTWVNLETSRTLRLRPVAA